MMDSTTLFPTTPSALWNAAWGAEPIGPAWNHDDTACVLCGAPVRLGSPAIPADRRQFDKAFNFKIEAKFKGNAACGHCLRIWENFWMQKGSKSYAVFGRGVFWLSKNTDIAAFLLSPPEAAYVAIFNTRQQAQMIWRTRVAIPSGTLQVRIDDDILLIDRDRVLRGIEAWQSACRILIEVGRPKGAPYLLSYNLASSATGLRHPVNAPAVAAHSTEGKEAIELLAGLTMADWWALSACREVDLRAPDLWPKRRRITEEDARKPPNASADSADSADGTHGTDAGD